MKLTIHRGAHEVGGSCVELEAVGKRLVLDLGMPLTNLDGPLETSLPNIPALYRGGDVVGLILSHAHPDHYGLADFVHSTVPVYASEGTRALLRVSRLFLPRPLQRADLLTLRKEQAVAIGDFKITGIPVDHSAPDALALLVEAEGRRVLYSGDFRAHGRKASLFEHLLRQPPKEIDCLLLEGTTLGRDAPAYVSERAVEEALVAIFTAKANLAFLFCSSQNIDRLVSAYKASRRAGCTLVIDLYTAYVLHSLRSLSSKLPQMDWPGIRVKQWYRHRECLRQAGEHAFLEAAAPASVRMHWLIRNRRRAVLLSRTGIFPQVARRLPELDGVEVIWSLWRGYLSGEDAVSRFCRDHSLPLRHIHVSGHASVADLKRLAQAISPKRVIPIHTFEPDRYPEHFANVLSLADGQALDLETL